MKPFRSGNLLVAADAISAIEGAGETDGVWIQMEKGSILKAAGRFRESRQVLEQCQEQMDNLLVAAGQESVAVGGLSGAGAVMTDDRQCCYVGALYESQLVCTLQMVNSLMLSDQGGAQAAVSAFRSRVDEAITIKQKVADYLAQQREQNEKARAEKAPDYQGTGADFQPGEADNALKSAYVSWADSSVGVGLYMAEVVLRESVRQGEFSAYISRAAADAESQVWNQAAYVSLAAGLRGAAEQLDATQPSSTTYVLVETGLAPAKERNAERERELSLGGLELPGLGRPEYSGKASVQAGGSDFVTHLVTDVAVLKQNEFAVNYPDIEHRAVLGKVIKESLKVAGLGTAVISNDRNAQLIGLFVGIFGAAASAAQGADLRSWDCLPFHYRVAAIPTPDDGKVAIVVDDARVEVQVVPGVSNLVVATSVAPNHCVAYSSTLIPRPVSPDTPAN